jgi:hypothetical protein
MKRPVFIVSGVVWLLSVSAGLAALSWYANQPARPAAPPARWPTSSRIVPADARANLVMLLHPHCPCSRASIEELDRLMARVGDSLSLHVLFVRPAGVGEDWDKTDLWRSAAAIPGVDVRDDEDGSEARLFHAATSGQVILYDAGGHLLFSGGITPSRGHAGDSAGRDAIVALLRVGTSPLHESHVFGCSLFSPDDAAASVGG